MTATCPTCGPTRAEPHPRLAGVIRCGNCGEHLEVLEPHHAACRERTDGEDAAVAERRRQILDRLRASNDRARRRSAERAAGTS